MALKRISNERAVAERTYEKLRRDLDYMRAAHPDRGRIQLELNSIKTRMSDRKVVVA